MSRSPVPGMSRVLRIGQDHDPVISHPQIVHTQYPIHSERTVQMRKQISAARDFPFEGVPQTIGPDRNHNQISLSGKVFLKRGRHLMGG